MIAIQANFKNPMTGKSDSIVFRTNNDGSYLFKGVSSNTQISCDSGFTDETRMKRAIRSHLRYVFGCDMGEPELGRITYS